MLLQGVGMDSETVTNKTFQSQLILKDIARIEPSMLKSAG